MTSMVDGFQYVRGVFRTASQLLLASDALVTGRGFKPYYIWPGLVPYEAARVTKPNDCLHFSAQRHSRNGQQRHLAIATVFYDPWDDGFQTPLCIASTFESSSNGNDLYWAALALAWAQGGHQPGVVRAVTFDDIKGHDQPFWTAEWSKAVPSGTLRAVAQPLEKIRSIQDIETWLLVPLLGAIGSDGT